MNANKPLPPRVLIDATRQLALLARLGYPLGEGLQKMGDASPWLTRVSEEVAEGDTLSQALGRHPRVFSPFFSSMVEAAEVAEKPEKVLTTLSTWLERAEDVRSRLRLALLHPWVTLEFLLLEVVLLCAWIVPQLLLPLARMLAATHGGLPPWVPGLVDSHALTALAALAWLVVTAAALPGLGIESRIASWLPYAGALRELGEQSLWARAAGTLLAAGVALPQALAQAARIVQLPGLRAGLAALPEHLRRGDTLAQAIARCDDLDPYLAWSVASGEESGELASRLLDAADLLDDEMAIRTQTAIRMAEPWATGAVGLLVLLGLLCFWWPFYQMAGQSGHPF